MPPKITRNVVLEDELIETYGLARHIVLGWSREQQSAVVENLRPLYNDAVEAREAAAEREAEQRRNEREIPETPIFAVEVIEAVAVANPELGEPMDVTDAVAVASPELGEPMDVNDDEHVDIDQLDNDENAANNEDIEQIDLTGENEWLLQQPLEPPIARQPAAEIPAPLPELLGPVNQTLQRRLDGMTIEQRRPMLQNILNHQWRALMAPPTQHIMVPAVGAFEANPDIQHAISHLPIHLQYLVSRLPLPSQHAFVLQAPLQQYRLLRDLYIQERVLYNQHVARRRQDDEERKRRINADPLLARHPDVRHWLNMSSMAHRQRWLSSTHDERMNMLQEAGLLIQMQRMQVDKYRMEQALYRLEQQRVAPPEPIPARLRIVEDAVRVQHGFGDQESWNVSVERAR